MPPTPETTIEDANQNAASSEGLSRMADKWDSLVRTNASGAAAPDGKGAAAAAAPDAGKGAAAAPDPKAAEAAAAAAKAKADEAIKAALKPEDDENHVPPSIKSPKAAEDFKLIKKRALTAEAKLREQETAMTSKLKEAEDKLKGAAKSDPKEVETLKAEVEKYRGLVESVSLELDPSFQAKYESRAKAVVDQLKQFIPEAKLKQLGELLTMPDGPMKQQQLLEIADGLDEFQKLELFQASRDFRALANERNTELSKSREKLAELQKGKQAESDQVKQRLTQAFDAAVDRAKDKEKGMSPFQARDGDEEWNKGIEDRVKLARHIYDGGFETDAERADAAFWAASAETILRDAIAAKQQVAELTARLQKISGASPTIKDGGKGAEAETKTPKTFSGRVAASLSQGRG